MKNKKGLLLAETTLKIIIAVICLAFLAYFLMSLYFNKVDAENLELAKASLEHLVEEINAGNSGVEIYNPEGWVILSWPYEGEKPSSCLNMGWDDCLCICDNPGIFDTAKDLFTGHNKIQSFAEECDENGICLQSEFKIERLIPISSPPVNLEIKDKEITKK